MAYTRPPKYPEKTRSPDELEQIFLRTINRDCNLLATAHIKKHHDGKNKLSKELIYQKYIELLLEYPTHVIERSIVAHHKGLVKREPETLEALLTEITERTLLRGE